MQGLEEHDRKGIRLRGSGDAEGVWRGVRGISISGQAESATLYGGG